MYKKTTLSCPVPPSSTPVRATPSELPWLRRSSSCKRPDGQNPPAKPLLANTHAMSLERRKHHRHDAPPSWIDPSLYWDGCTRAPAVESRQPRTTAPTQVQIFPENSGRKARREDGVKRHQAIRGHQPALLRRTPGISRVPEAMVTSLVGDGEDKPALWPSRVRSSLQAAARTVENSERSGVIATPYSALHAKSSSSVRREPPGRPKSAARSAHSPTQRGATGADYKTQRCRRVANSPLPITSRRHQKPPPRGSRRPPAPICGVLERPNLPRSTAVRVPCPPAALALPRPSCRRAAPSRTSPSAAAAPDAATAGNFDR